MVRKTTSVAKAPRKTAAAKNSSSKAAATTAVKKSSEIKPRRVLSATGQALATTARKLKSPKVLVPLAVAVGVGVAAVARLINGSNGKNSSTLPRLAKEISPRFAEAVHALADLGRELRAKVR